jgi:cytochrome c peroxidase
MRSRRAWGWAGIVLVVGILGAAGCEKAQRYTAPPSKSPSAKSEENKPKQSLAFYDWIVPDRGLADAWINIPIVFVDAATDAEEWAKLKEFWTQWPGPALGQRTAHLGQSPLGALAALMLADQLEVIKIKVPLGLPNPTPYIPGANPPTYAKWRLGKKLFYDEKLLSDVDLLSCATCHKPEHGFSETLAKTRSGRKHTPSLINSVYNKYQFWDGRVTSLEQVIQRDLEDEREPSSRAKSESPAARHVWHGVVRRLRKDDDYRKQFEQVFGIKQPTQDAIGKAVATYLRTILSGNSLYDQANQERAKRRAREVEAQDYKKVLDSDAVKSLDPDMPGKNEDERVQEAARRLAHGYQLFQGKARCILCHKNQNFTDDDFHNTGVREHLDLDLIAPQLGKEPGRNAQVPAGLKEVRLIGAYKTPTLRNLLRAKLDPKLPALTVGLYMHSGVFNTLEEVVNYFNKEIVPNPSLAVELLAGPDEARRLDLDAQDVRDLVLFLKSLQGEGVARIVAPK